MAKALQRRRGTTEEHASFTGLEGEFTYDTTEKRVVAHDGVTAGGTPMAKKSEIVDAKSELQQAIDNAVAEIGGTIDTIEGSIAELRKHNVGEEWVSYTGVIPQGGVPYLGQEVTREMYSDLWAYAQANGLVVSESEWQSLSSSQNGNVGKYSSGNGSTSFRMPRIVGYVKGASSLDEAGAYIKEGLPNIEGYLGDIRSDSVVPGFSAGDGALIWANTTTPLTGGGSGTTYGFDLDFDASRYNPIYGNSSHVTPETSVVLFGVYAFGEVTNAGSVDVQSVVNAIARVEAGYLPLTGGEVNGVIVNAYGDLIRQKHTSGWTSIKGGTNNATGGYVSVYGKDNNNGAAVLCACNGQAVTELKVHYNGTATLKGHRILTINNPSVPNYSAGVDISTEYTAPTAGYVVIDSMGSYSGYTELYVNSVRVSVFKTTAQMDASCTAFVGKGDVIHFKNGGGEPRSRFYPIKVGG